jgi:hypothetical protein
MSVSILIEFKGPCRRSRYIPVATQGVYHSEWQETAEKLGLKWVPEFENGPSVKVEELPEVMEEIRKLRAVWANNPKKDWLLERIDFILEQLSELNLDEVSEIFIG